MDPHRLAEERSLAYHRVIADRIATDPGAIARARSRIGEWAERRLIGQRYVDGWRRLLDGPLDVLLSRLVADDDDARAMRQTAPFPGVLGPKERWAIWRRVRDEVRLREAADSARVAAP